MFIDTHSHLYLGELQHHIPEAIENLKKYDFSHSIQIWTSVETSQKCIDLSKKYEILRATVGIHPCEAQDIDTAKISEQCTELKKMILTEKGFVVGLGEIGFDHYHLMKDEESAKEQKDRQIEWFRAQAEIALEHDLPVVIHSRQCRELTLKEITNSGLKKFVIHCFSEDWDFAKKIFDISDEAKISFTGIVTYPKALSVKEVAEKSPLNRIMIETDAPYLIPEQVKNSAKYGEPSFSRFVFEELISLRKESREDLETQIYKNSKDFFQL